MQLATAQADKSMGFRDLGGVDVERSGRRATDQITRKKLHDPARWQTKANGGVHPMILPDCETSLRRLTMLAGRSLA